MNWDAVAVAVAPSKAPTLGRITDVRRHLGTSSRSRSRSIEIWEATALVVGPEPVPRPGVEVAVDLSTVAVGPCTLLMQVVEIESAGRPGDWRVLLRCECEL